MKQEKALQDLGRELLFLVDIKGKIKSYNRAAEKTFGKKLTALPLTKVLDNSSHHLLMHYVTECLLNRKEQHFPFVYHSKYYDVIMQPQQEDVAVSMLERRPIIPRDGIENSRRVRSPLDSMLVSVPLRLVVSSITVPAYSSGQSTVISSIGSHLRPSISLMMTLGWPTCSS